MDPNLSVVFQMVTGTSVGIIKALIVSQHMIS